MAIGPRLREARQNKQLTTSQVAEMTRMKVQIVDDLENDDFHRIAATIYGKGFIKLFAECVDVDPTPLIDDYMQQMGVPAPPKLPVQQEPEPPTEDGQADIASPEQAAAPDDDLFSYADQSQRRAKKSAPTVKQSDSHHHASASRPTVTESLFAAARRIWLHIQHAATRGTEIIIKTVTETGAHDKWIQRGLLAVGIIVAILILVPLGRMLFTQRATAPLPDDTLMLFVQPPEPYIE